MVDKKISQLPAATTPLSGTEMVPLVQSSTTKVATINDIVDMVNEATGLENVTNDAQLKRAAGDFASFTNKTTPVGADLLLIEDSASANAKKKISISSVSHTTLADIGTNTHAQIDSHIADLNNPHAVTQAQVGLSNVTNVAQLTRSAGDFATFTAATGPVATDIILIEEAGSGFAKRKATLNSISHTLLADVGTNTHAQIDSHVASTSNPHAVTKSQVGLGNVTNDAQVPLAGGTMTGLLTLSGAPTTGLHATTKTYSDNRARICYSFTSSSPYIQNATASFTTEARLYWPGSTAFGTVSQIKAIMELSAGTVTSSGIQIYDSTNSLVIATVSFLNLNPTIVDLGALSNISAGEAIWDIQMRRSGTGNVRLYALSVK